MANIKATRLDRRLGRDRRAAVAARLLLHLPAAPRLRRPADRPRQRRRRCGRGRAGRGDRPAGRRHGRRLRRGTAVARGRRIRHHAGRPRDAIPTACSARPACWRSARRTTASISISSRAGPSPWSITSSRTSSWPTATSRLAAQVADLFRGQPGIAEVLVGTQRGRYRPRTSAQRRGDPDLHAATAGRRTTGGSPTIGRPRFARTVDIHRKPGYDPVELFFDPATKSIPLDADAGQRLARRPGRRSLAADRAAGLRADAVPRPGGRTTPTCSASC